MSFDESWIHTWIVVILAHKVRLYPNNNQVTYFKKACGISRFTYNWALAENRRLHEAGVKTSEYDLRRRFNAIKKQRFPWTGEVTKWACQRPFRNFWHALGRWWKSGLAPPSFKKKGKCKDSFYFSDIVMSHGVRAVTVRTNGKKIHIPRLGWVRMAEELRFPGLPKSCVISRGGDGYPTAHSSVTIAGL